MEDTFFGRQNRFLFEKIRFDLKIRNFLSTLTCCAKLRCRNLCEKLSRFGFIKKIDHVIVSNMVQACRVDGSRS